MLKRKPKVLTPEQMEEIRTKDFFDCILPGTIKFLSDHYIVGDSYRCAWVIREYPPSTEEQAILSQLADLSGVTLRIYHRLVESMEQRKIIQNATRRNKLKSGGNDVNETIEAEGNLQDVVELLANLRKNREPLLHCSVFIELKARNMDGLKELQSDIAMELTRSKISVDRLTLRQKEGFLSVLPVGANQFGSQYERVLPASSVANLYPFITGTEMKKRDDFNRLLRDCRKRKIDRVITKTVSRFARNTAELLTVVRALKELGVSVYFEEQGIDTETLDLEMILTFPGMAAQKESETISENMRWSYRKRMETGEFNCCRAAYGYSLIDGELQINEAEAKVVRRIFHLYLQGCGKQAIANQLNTEGVPKRYGQKTWYLSAIDYVLNNERYMGDSLLQKSYTTETLPFRKKRNHGEKAQYYVENSNPAIISRETYQATQELQKRRFTDRHVPKNQYPFSGMLKCPVCGHNYRRQAANGTAYWLCSYKASGRTECGCERISEQAVMEAFTRMSDKLTDNREELLGDLIRQLEKLQSRTSGSGEKVYELNRQIADINAQSLVVAQLHGSGILNNAEYAVQSGELNRRASELRSERRRILMEDEDNEVIESLKALNDTIADYTPTGRFDEELFGQIVESVTVISGNVLRFCLAGGLALTEKI